MPLSNTKRGNPAIDGLPHRIPSLSQFSIIARRGDRQLCAARLENLEPAEFAQCPAERGLIANPLQDLA